MSELKVLVDIREPTDKVYKALKDMRIPVKRKQLAIGDYVVGSIAVERKTTEDYIGSLKTRRLENQLYRLSTGFKLSYLIIEGDILWALMNSGLHRHSFFSSLIGSSFKRSLEGEQGQIITLNVSTYFDTALCIRYIRDKEIAGEARMFSIPKIKASPNQLIVYVLSSMPGIGQERAKSLLKTHDTLRNVFRATNWMAIDGIGDKINFKSQTLLDTVYEENGE